MFRQIPLLPGILVIAVLHGCGGGGGSSGGSGGAIPYITFDRSSLSVAAAVNAVTPPPATITATFSNLPPDAAYVGANFSNDIIAGLNFDPVKLSRSTLTIYFNEPFHLAPGVHNGTIQLALCRDINCANTIPNSQASVTVTYTISAPGPQAMPTASMGTSQISVSALTTGEVLSVSPGTTIAGIVIPIHVINAAYPISVSASTTNSTIVNATANPALNGTEATLSVQLKYPNDLGLGTFHDDIRISACLDPVCVNPLTVSPLMVSVDYVVTDAITKPGSSGYTLRFLNIPNSDTFAVDTTRGLVDIVQSDSSGAIVTSVQPSTGAVVARQTGVNARLVIRLTSDGTYAYTATFGGVARLKLPDWTLDATYPFELNQFGTVYDTADIQIVPGSNNSFAVARTYGGAYGIPADVTAYDGATKRTNSVVTPYAGAGPQVAFLAWGTDAGTLFGSPPPSAGAQASWQFAIDSNGVTQPTPAFSYGGGRFAFGFGRLFFPIDGLQVVDATTGTLLASGLVPASSLSCVVVDSQLGTVYVLGKDMQGNSVLYVLDGQSLALLRSATFDAAYQPEGQMARWGTNGLVLSDTTRVYLLSGLLVGP